MNMIVFGTVFFFLYIYIYIYREREREREKEREYLKDQETTYLGLTYRIFRIILTKRRFQNDILSIKWPSEIKLA